MSNKKYVGTTVDGYWKVICREELSKETRYAKYTLQNELNGTTIIVGNTVFSRIVKGETSVSKVLSSRIRKKHIDFGFNNQNDFKRHYKWIRESN